MKSTVVTSADSVQLPVPANAVPWQHNGTAANTTCADHVSLHICGRAQSTAVPIDN